MNSYTQLHTSIAQIHVHTHIHIHICTCTFTRTYSILFLVSTPIPIPILIPVPVRVPIPIPVPIHIPIPIPTVYLYLHGKEIIKLLINFSEFFASFPCTRNRNRIPNTVPVPKSPNEYGSDRFRFRLRNPAYECKQVSSVLFLIN